MRHVKREEGKRNHNLKRGRTKLRYNTDVGIMRQEIEINND